MANISLVLCVCFCAYIALCSANCGQVFENTVSEKDQAIIVDKHNNLRSLISQGKVPGQPKGTNLRIMKWDDKLAQEAQKIANTCRFEHVRVKDSRFPGVGQNLGWSGEISSAPTQGADWQRVIQSWFDEYKDFQYPNQSRGVTGHYTQVVWAATYLVGCGFTWYKSNAQYEKLYVCNYGPPGNYIGQAPYRT